MNVSKRDSVVMNVQTPLEATTVPAKMVMNWSTEHAKQKVTCIFLLNEI